MDFAKELSAQKARLVELEALEGRVSCPRCGHANDADRQRCSECGFTLPQNVGSTTTSTFQTKESGGLDEAGVDLLLTSNVVKLYEAINAVAEGGIDDATFLGEVGKFEALINAANKSLPEEAEISDPSQEQYVNKLYELFDEGVGLFSQGTELLRSFVDSRDLESLKEAVLIIDRGAKCIDSARTAATPQPQ